MMTRDKMITRLKGKISATRLTHSFGVEYTAACLAMVHGEDVEKARIAGLLHDCAKGLPTKTKLEKARKHGLPVSKYEEKNPDMLHAKLGAYYARYKYDVVDQVILDAITYHTTGRPNMTLMDKIIFVADYIEPNRKLLEHLPAIRQMAFIDLDEAVYLILRDTVDYLGESDPDKENEIEHHTLEAYEYYRKLHEAANA